MTAATICAAAGAAAGAAALAGRFLPGPWRILACGVLLKPSFALRELLEAGERVEARLLADDLDGARAALRSMDSRETLGLDEPLLAGAAIESLAESLCNSFVAPILGHSFAGLPGAWAYRAASTLDSRIGHHGAHEFLGKAAARTEDVLSFLPARLSARLIALAAVLLGEDAAAARHVMRRDAGRTGSPNAGWPMSAAAGALGLRLEKPGHYRLNPEGGPPAAADIGRARRLVLASAGLAALLALLFPGGIHARRTSA